MSPTIIFNLQLGLGYICWLLVLAAYAFPKLGSMAPADVQRAIAVLHAFRFFGLVFILPGVVGQHLPASFAQFAAFGDFATGVLAMLALVAFRVKPLFWLFVIGFNLVGAGDILIDYYHGVQLGLPEIAGELGFAYAIVMIYVPLLMITHALAFYLMLRPAAQRSRDAALQPISPS